MPAPAPPAAAVDTAPAAAGRGLPVYSEREAQLFYHYALAAFCRGPAIRRWDCGENCLRAAIVPGTARYLAPSGAYRVQGYVAVLPEDEPQGSSSRRCVVGFRGSQPMNLGNLLADYLLIMGPWPRGGEGWCPGCLVHKGFAGAYADVRPSLLVAIRELNCTSVALAGHSLGAALATLASMELRAGLDVSVEAVWTYGKPRVGNANFVEAYIRAAQRQGVDPPLWRVVQYRDPIPRMNLYSLPWHPRHEPLEVYYTTEDSSIYRLCPPTPRQLENPECMLATPVWKCSFSDHMKYLRLPFKFPAVCGFRKDLGGERILVLIGVAVALAMFLLCRRCFCHRFLCCRSRANGPGQHTAAGATEMSPGSWAVKRQYAV